MVGFHLRECRFSRSDDILSLRFVMFTDALNILASPVYLLVDKQGDLKKTCWNAELVFGWDVKRSYRVYMDSAMYMYRYLFIYLSLCMCTCIYFDTNVQFFLFAPFRLQEGIFCQLFNVGSMSQWVTWKIMHVVPGVLWYVFQRNFQISPQKKTSKKSVLNPSVSKKKVSMNIASCMSCLGECSLPGNSAWPFWDS